MVTLEVLSNEPNTTNRILMAFKRRGNIFNDDNCNQVAKELRLIFEKKDNGNLFFKDNV